jgi:putative hydrolase of the HAD superfamily
LIKTIIFDLGKVIIPFDFHRAYEKIAPLCNMKPDEVPERLRNCDLVTRFESGLIEPEPFVQELSERLGLVITYQDFSTIWTSIFLPDTLIPESLLIALRERYRLLLLSNTNAIHFEMVSERYPLLRHFHEYVLSYKVGAMKPSPLIYQAALGKAQCQPDECFFTDDIPAYVEGAKAHGIDAVQFQSAAQIETELHARGVMW